MEDEKDKPVCREPSTYSHALSPSVHEHGHSSVQPQLRRYHLYMCFLNRISCYPQTVSSLKNECKTKVMPVSKLTSNNTTTDIIRYCKSMIKVQQVTYFNLFGSGDYITFHPTNNISLVMLEKNEERMSPNQQYTKLQTVKRLQKKKNENLGSTGGYVKLLKLLMLMKLSIIR